ncbi:hypothetical protein CLAFUW4_07815 [Fulvia fulva]|uniref:DUF202 domain-containing protein n=1 Tax=Passalora fulva TaxID=5499 RepID=A0A9Q8LC83_PASFU|nr:uncharacterized protein CLAFUR5_07939 [Fulvia fulva]KAK4629612.1 hypothetical protein CLAFUR4_07820 [Fulvia fulva]KAK4630375.1 hypothetical protein CLAFUR0_07817 [Fulvia fulva]UJO14719.1 hypothetical protein CLAFUR5_07939 [Fulvia fulva]WPV12175.1 hypothetical protein CLAFUW4_07815 [Fulvia fulva]WPV27521.1 hypothetical protein CLAFUW7_07816 [Fulvia fulva]
MEQRPSQQISGDAIRRIPEPEPVHIPDDGREAINLPQVAGPGSRHKNNPNPPSADIAAHQHWYDLVRKFWRNHVRLSVPHVDCRDHLANERTFLGYLRTSVALSMLGVIVAQLYRLQHHPSPSPIFGYFILSKPISAILQCSALGMAILGAIRYFRQQAAMARGKVHAGGWEVMVIVVFSSLVGRYWCWVVRREFGHLK